MFHVSLLEQYTTKKGRMNEFVKVPKFKLGDDKEYKVEAIQDSAYHNFFLCSYLTIFLGHLT